VWGTSSTHQVRPQRLCFPLLGATWATCAMFWVAWGAARARLGRNCDSCGARVGCVCGVFGTPSECVPPSAGRPLGAGLRPSGLSPPSAPTAAGCVRILGAYLERIGRVLGPCWERIGSASGASRELIESVLRAYCERIGSTLGAFCDRIGGVLESYWERILCVL
jgi:hypothetical protein